MFLLVTQNLVFEFDTYSSAKIVIFLFGLELLMSPIIFLTFNISKPDRKIQLAKK